MTLAVELDVKQEINLTLIQLLLMVDILLIGILPVNNHAVISILNFNYIKSCILFSSMTKLSKYVHYKLSAINYWSTFCYLCFKVLYFNKLPLLSAVLPLDVVTSALLTCV